MVTAEQGIQLEEELLYRTGEAREYLLKEDVTEMRR